MTVEVHIPNFAFPELSYMMDYFTENINEIDFLYQKSDTNNVELKYNTKTIVLENSFFDKTKIDFSSHFHLENIPDEMSQSSLSMGRKSFPIASIYGSNEIQFTESECYVKADLLGSGFFMLTRWEEQINQEKDVHGRFTSNESLVVKNNVHKRPIVDEYREIFLETLKWLIGNVQLKEKKYSIIPTHDIDQYQFVQSKVQKVGKWIKAFLTNNKESKKALRAKDDIYNQHEYLMKLAENAQVKAYFFFLMGGNSSYDPRNSRSEIERAVQQVQQRGHQIGIHPSYEFINDDSLLVAEKDLLEKETGQKIHFSRNHYLRPESPKVYNTLINNGITVDFTMGFADQIGFRAGVSSSYSAFDWMKRKKLPLRIQPLQVMDVSLKDYLQLSPEESLQEIKQLQEQTKKYNGDFCFLWHNSSFEIDGWKDYEKVLPELYN